MKSALALFVHWIRTLVQACSECIAPAQTIKYNKGYIDYARPWAPMYRDADDVVGALQERLLCIGAWRDDLIVADPFMKLASWQTRVSPALLTNVSKMFIVRAGRCSPVIQADMEEFRTIRPRTRDRTARRAHHVGIALASLPWARHHSALLSCLISSCLWPNQGNR